MTKEYQSIQSCPTLYDPMGCSPPGFSVLGILQARILEWVAIPFSGGSSRLRERTQFSGIAGRFFTICATWKAPNNDRSWCQTWDSLHPEWRAGGSQTLSQSNSAPTSKLWDLKLVISVPLSLCYLIYKIRKVTPSVQNCWEVGDTNKEHGD